MTETAGTAANIISLWASGSCSGYLKSDGTCSTPSSSVAWDAITNPAGNMALSMGTKTSIFSGTAATSQFFAWKNTTAAVVGTSQGSPILANCGRGFHGSADVEDCMTLGELPGNGNDAAITFTLGHTGTSTGSILLAFPNVNVTANNVILGVGAAAGATPQTNNDNVVVGYTRWLYKSYKGS